MALENQAVATTSRTTTMESLPTELLIDIFVHLADQSPTETLTLRGVCRRWSNIADSLPALWRRIHLNHTCDNVLYLQRIAELYLQKSEPLFIDVRVMSDDANALLPILSPLLPSVSRWRSFSVGGFRTEIVDMSDQPFSSSGVSPVELDSLVLNLIPESDLDDFDSIELDEDSPFAIDHPTFGQESSISFWVTSLPSPGQLVPLHFTNLTITESAGSAKCTASVLDVLSACPLLRSFMFEGWLHEDNRHTYDQPSSIVMLPHLEMLFIKTTSMTRSILSCLSTPRLQTLSLTYLNVEYRIPSAEKFGDEGDSDDEANDFSQSPWSDQATGMGLRSLLSRCRPPIRVLVMDYSDLRTKDFQWVFDRLNTLEEFRIVASDMSDKVIGLLKPEYTEDGQVRMRLPRLNKLELLLCQRLTGAAIVGALLPRAIFTDSTSERHRFNKLKRVFISGCDGVQSQHELLMRLTLGPRFIA
ncbi:hypothetical protein FA15DRAFT_635373 [Coprinopsis marcescibilis]|uniref:F-box domain-containing protein n=1 Tax=Coprinopsis marcescibilis TaxID=230819 RepID=A0A5C3L4Q2_COPMA|nr:hypothetical protein FA15DRAFT_635373 [Coprinopsis marcescibilis]